LFDVINRVRSTTRADNFEETLASLSEELSIFSTVQRKARLLNWRRIMRVARGGSDGRSSGNCEVEIKGFYLEVLRINRDNFRP
jgi:hypothetical protein